MNKLCAVYFVYEWYNKRKTQGEVKMRTVQFLIDILALYGFWCLINMLGGCI